MTIIDLDLTNYKDRFGSYLTPDRYHVVVEDLEVVPTKKEKEEAQAQRRAPRANMMNVWLRVVGGENDGLVQTDRLMLEGAAQFRIVGFLQALGMSTKRGKMRLDGNRILGKHLMIDVKDGDPYNGNVRSEVSGYVRMPKGSQVADAPASDLPEDLVTDEVEEAPASAIADASEPPFEPDATPAEDDAPATASPRRAAPADPETVSLEDIDLG